jgi:hypothetical protein
MTFKYRALTANCGNDSLGEATSKMLAKRLQRDDADFYVINCQELAFDKALLQLQAAVGPDYNVFHTATMETHTKFATQFHSGTGITSLVIHKKNLEIICLSSQITRRSNSRFAGSAYNKGGLVSDIVIRNKDTNDHLNLQTVSGHLDSGNSRKRNKDWQLLNQAIAKQVTDWDSLVDAIPHLRVSGYDANTRNKIIDGEVVNLWQADSMDADLQALQQIVIAGLHFSKQSTYKTSSPGISTAPDSKRPGYACGGMLDFIGIADGNRPNLAVIESGVIQIGSEKGCDRDHDVLISPLQHYETLSDFLLVKKQMAILLARVAPGLAEEILALQNNEVNRVKLTEVYKLFLSPNGILNTLVNFHLEKLENFERLSRESNFYSEALKKELSETIFPPSPWLDRVTLDNMAEAATKLPEQKHAMGLLFLSISQCYSESGCTNRLEWYGRLQKDFEKDSYQQAKASRYLREQILQEYFVNYRKLQHLLKDFKPNTPNELNFVKKGREVLTQASRISGNKMSIETLGSKSVSQLSSVLDHCIKTVEVVKNAGDATMVSEHLVNLSKEVSGKAAPGWEDLGASLLILACIALVITGVLASVSTGGSSVLIASAAGTALASFAAGIGILEQSSKKGLAKSISDFQLALEYVCDEDVSSHSSILCSG